MLRRELEPSCFNYPVISGTNPLAHLPWSSCCCTSQFVCAVELTLLFSLTVFCSCFMMVEFVQQMLNLPANKQIITITAWTAIITTTAPLQKRKAMLVKAFVHFMFNLHESIIAYVCIFQISWSQQLLCYPLVNWGNFNWWNRGKLGWSLIMA